MSTIVLVAGVGVGACGSKTPDPTAAAAAPKASTTVAAGAAGAKPTTTVKEVTTTTTSPRTTLKKTANCAAYARFSFAVSAVSLAKPEQRAAVIETAKKVSEEIKKAAPEVATDAGKYLDITSKNAGKAMPAADQTEYDRITDVLETWKENNCL